MNDEQKRLNEMVQEIANNLVNGITYKEAGIDPCDGWNDDEDIISAWAYLEDALDIQYVLDSSGHFLGGRVLVSFGGPNIWIDTQHDIVEGFWWGDYAKADFDNDAMAIHEALSEMFYSNISSAPPRQKYANIKLA